MKITKLDEKIWVFNQLVKNPEEHIKFYTEDPANISRWTPWYLYGESISDSGFGWGQSEEFPTKEQWTNQFIQEGDPYKAEIADLFYDATKLYIEETNVSLPNWISPNWGIARYNPDVPGFKLPHHQGKTMYHHSDYQQEFSEYAGEKFAVTAVVYLNDEYEGGEIYFRITDPNDDSKVVKEVIYKPTAGDMLVFPSTPPYYHGVLNVEKHPKYILRLYWKYYKEATEVWKSLQEKYGVEEFRELERVRRKRPDMTLSDPVLRPRMSMSEYYRLMDAGELKDDYRNE